MKQELELVLTSEAPVSINTFEEYAERYDAWYEEEGKILYENEVKCVKNLIHECEGKALEVVVGTGRFANLSKNVVGVDISFQPLKIAKKLEITVIQANAEELPFKNEVFSCAMMIVTICFLENPLKALKEAYRVLKNSGKLIIGAVFVDSLWGRFYEEKKRYGHPFYSFAKFYDFQEFKKITNKAGFKIKRIFGTLKFSTPERHQYEEPIEIKTEKEISNFGFLCIELVK